MELKTRHFNVLSFKFRGSLFKENCSACRRARREGVRVRRTTRGREHNEEKHMGYKEKKCEL
jgi:hypothetical protein